MSRLNPAPTRSSVYLSEATLPVYIIHHAPLLLIGWFVLPLAVPVWLKVMMIWLAATAISLVAYHWLIKPWVWARWLMGMTVSSPKPMSEVPTEPNVVPETT